MSDGRHLPPDPLDARSSAPSRPSAVTCDFLIHHSRGEAHDVHRTIPTPAGGWEPDTTGAPGPGATDPPVQARGRDPGGTAAPGDHPGHSPWRRAERRAA